MYVLAWLNWFPKEEMTATTINRRYADFVLWRWGFVPTDHIDPHKYTHTYPITSHRQADRWITKCSQMCCFTGSRRFLVRLCDSIVSICVCSNRCLRTRATIFVPYWWNKCVAHVIILLLQYCSIFKLYS